jgi:hypothetical protein
MSKTYIAKLGKITDSNGVPCINPIITFEKPNCPNIECLPTTDAAGVTTIKIEVPDDCPDGCVDVKIDCSSSCSTCGEQRFRICPCTVDSDCPDCSTCGENGYCITKCLPGEFCSGDRCVECDEFTPCKNGQVCEGGKCKCPPSKPYKNQKGECVECNESTALSPCQFCDGGVIKNKTCPEGVLNPDTCLCVSCLKDSDCNKPNEKCGPNGCECIDGFRRNPVTGDCEPRPICTRDIDCGDCGKCLADGNCGDYVCPPGYAPSKIPGECCVKLCDCSNPSCPPGSKCINLDGTQCYCQDCNVKCDNGKCPDGCMCKDGTNCAPNPCGGKCDPNTPCPPGCGCDENGDCVPCKNLDCDQCKKTPNCDCTTPDNCTPSDCAGPCDENTPCPGQDCGCTKERQCVNCRKVDCLKNSDCPEGCDCMEDKKCGKSPCAEVNCQNDTDCGIDCKCDEGGKCKPCAPGDPNCGGIIEPCADTLDIKDNGDCSLKGILTFQSTTCCECIQVHLHAALTTTANDRTVQSILKTAGGIALSATGIAGDASINGQVRYTWDQVLKEVNNAGAILPGGAVINITGAAVTIFTNTDVSSITAAIKPNGSIVIVAGKKYKIAETTMYAESVGLLSNTINLCTYQLGKTLIYRKTATEAGNYHTLLNKVQKCRTPIFTWYKSLTGGTYTQVVKRYATKISNSEYVDIIRETDGLELCSHYKLSSDCGCVLDKFYGCGTGTKTTYVPYIPQTLDITQLDACGLSIKIKEEVICDLFKTTSLPWKLYINGAFHADINVDINHKIFTGDLTITKTVPIKEVKLVYPCDACTNPLIITLPTLGSNCFVCSDADTTLVLTGDCALGITASGVVNEHAVPANKIAGCELKIYVNNVLKITAITDALGVYSANIPVPSGNATYTVKVVNCFGCEVTDTIAIIDCCEATINGLQYNCATNIITSSVAGCLAPANFTLKQGISIIHSGVYSNSILVPFDLANGTYEFIVDCGSGCIPETTLVVACGIPDFTLVATCNGLQGKITASAFTGGSGAPYLLEYSINNFSSILGSSAVDPFQWNSTPGTIYQVRLKDAAGNVSFVKTITGLDCSVNAFTYQAFHVCDSGVQKFLIIPSIAGVFDVVITDFNSVVVFSGLLSLDPINTRDYHAYTTPPASGVATVAITYNGNTVNSTISIMPCAVATIAYNCTTGLSVTGVSSFNVHSAGYPPAGYGPFLTGDTNLFFSDGVNDTRTLTIKSPDGSEIYGTVGVNCCTHSIQAIDDICSGSFAKMKVVLNGVAGNYRVTVFNGLSQVCPPQTIVHAGGSVTYSIGCNLSSSTSYSVQVENLDYATKTYKDGLIGNITCSVTVGYTSTNCGGTGTGGAGCPITISDIVISGGCTPSITNNALFPVNALFKSTEFTNCTGQEFNEGTQITINPGQTVSYGALAHPNLGKKLYINYFDGNGDGCLLQICYSGCTGSSTCTLTDDPVASCDNVGATIANDRLVTTNTNAAAVLCTIDGVDKGMILPGGTRYDYYTHNTTHTIVFKCVDDISETRTLIYLLNC